MILQIMFGEESIKKRADAYDALKARRQQQKELLDEIESDQDQDPTK
jgi:hypothetical protein